MSNGDVILHLAEKIRQSEMELMIERTCLKHLKYSAERSKNEINTLLQENERLKTEIAAMKKWSCVNVKEVQR